MLRLPKHGGPKASPKDGSCSTAPLFCPFPAACGISRQPSPSLHFRSFLAPNGSSMWPNPIPPFPPFSGSFWHLTAAHSLSPFLQLTLAPGSPSPISISAISWQLAAPNGIPFSANLCQLVVALGIPSYPPSLPPLFPPFLHFFWHLMAANGSLSFLPISAIS